MEHRGEAFRMKVVLVAALGALACYAFALGEAPRDRIERCWSELTAAGSGELPECFLRFAADLSPLVLGERFEGASAGEKRRFERALAAALRRELPSGASFHPKTEEASRDGTRLVYGIEAADTELHGEATLLLALDGSLRDVLWNGGSVARRYRDECERTIERYSFEYLIGELEGRGVVVLEDFEDAPLEGLPLGWRRRDFSDRSAGMKAPYRVLEEDGNRFLRGEDRGENVMLYKEVRWDSKKYPYLSFRWRIRAVPAGSDERLEDKADSAAGLYLSYGRTLGLVPETVKFVWSGTVAAGTAFRRPGIGMPWTVVAGSGPADDLSGLSRPSRPSRGTWHRFVYDTGRVCRETFGKTPDERPLGIGLLTDANSTGSFAAADYDDIVALAHSPEENRIRKVESSFPN
jgi:Protein of unknown function (DUF3047)